MEISVICFTSSGCEIEEKIRKIKKHNITFYIKCAQAKKRTGCEFVHTDLVTWAGEQFEKKRAIIFVGATGIAVRSIAPFVKDKLSDSPVLVVDDMGKFVIPILSGHVGGANELALDIAEMLGAVPVITTSTDIHGRFAVDCFAKKNNLSIVRREGIAKVSAKSLRGECIRIALEDMNAIDSEQYNDYLKKYGKQIEFVQAKRQNDIRPVNEKKICNDIGEDAEITADVSIGNTDIAADLYLIPKRYVIGIGCKKGKNEQEIEELVIKCLNGIGIGLNEVRLIASVDIKAKEEGIVSFADKYNIPFVTFTKEELDVQKGDFNDSDFVKKQVGVGNVCERAAMAAWNDTKACLVLKKQAENGVTVAVSEGKWSIKYYE